VNNFTQIFYFFIGFFSIFFFLTGKDVKGGGDVVFIPEKYDRASAEINDRDRIPSVNLI